MSDDIKVMRPLEIEPWDDEALKHMAAGTAPVRWVSVKEAEAMYGRDVSAHDSAHGGPDDR